MNIRQKFLKAIYPILIAWGKLSGRRSTVLDNTKQALPKRSFYNLTVQLNNGSQLKLEAARGKKVLLVNTASNCGYTGQYDDLQKLHEQFGDKLLIIGFPANDFKEQEKGSDAEIAEFCRINFGVTFPLAKKSTVVKSNDQNEIFKWLTNKNENGWNTQPPTWNFSKYLVNEEGVLTHYFDPAVSPVSDEVVKAIASS
ncbi:MAG TPA: glutathione peroxidase [Chitinophagaceae bacterium]|nr:glutathione peroxidase [Chitinophagaceae bacterium]